MVAIQTFVFLDFGTVFCETPETCDQVTELSLRAVARQQFLEPNNTTAPKYSILLTFPDKKITIKDFTTINDFINIQKKPVCLFAHNGNRFDFGILKRHFNKLNKDLEKDILVADSIYAFHDILEKKDGGPAVRQYYWEPYSRPSVEYQLENVYKTVVTINRVEVKAHPAENDTYMLFRISHALGQRFLDWADNPNHHQHFAKLQDTNIQEP